MALMCVCSGQRALGDLRGFHSGGLATENVIVSGGEPRVCGVDIG